MSCYSGVTNSSCDWASHLLCVCVFAASLDHLHNSLCRVQLVTNWRPRFTAVRAVHSSSAALIKHIKAASQRDEIAYFSDAILNTAGLDTWPVAG